jgi:hemerythrin-like domain-containing protein
MWINGAGLKKENTVAMQLKGLPSDSVREDLSEYVAHLQLHMALQARNLVPSLSQTIVDSRQQMLHQTQATFEKMVSRQTL